MAFPNLSAAFETFLEPTRIHLFGKQFPTLVYDTSAMDGKATQALQPQQQPPREFETYTAATPVTAPAPDLPMPPGRVEQALRKAEDGIFARIYGFSYEGHYYKLPRPLLFLVQGPGQSRAPENSTATGEFSTRFTGIEGKDWQFGSDIRVWAVDRHDIAVCLDLEIGKYDEILLQSMIALQEEGTARGTAMSTRSASQSRGTAMATRSAASFRSAMIGPHRDR